MDSYPVHLGMAPGSKRVGHKNRTATRTVRGYKVRVNDLVNTSDFIILYRNISGAKKDTIQAFFDAHKTATFAIVWPYDGLTYHVEFGDQEPYPVRQKGDFWHIDLKLIGRLAA